MNSVSLMGRLTSDPAMTTAGETKVAKFRIAVPRRKKDETDFINVTAFGKTAEVIEKYFKKGNRIALTGRIQTGSYTNKEGKTVYTVDVVADGIDFVDGKSDAPKSDSDFMKVDSTSKEELPFI